VTKPVVQAVSAVITDEQGRVLLIQRGHEPARGLWSIPGGSVEAGEGLEEALRREVREETGLLIEVGQEVWVGIIELAEGVDYEIHTFTAEATGGTLQPGDDAARAEFTSPSEFVRRSTTPQLAEILARAGWPSIPEM